MLTRENTCQKWIKSILGSAPPTPYPHQHTPPPLDPSFQGLTHQYSLTRVILRPHNGFLYEVLDSMVTGRKVYLASKVADRVH